MFPLFQAFGLKFTPSWRFLTISIFRPLRRATADRGGSDELLKKLEQNFQTGFAVKSPINYNLSFMKIIVYPFGILFADAFYCGDLFDACGLDLSDSAKGLKEGRTACGGSTSPWRSEEPHKWGVPLSTQSLFKLLTRFFLWQ